MSDLATRLREHVDAAAPPVDIEALVKQLERRAEPEIGVVGSPARRIPGWAYAMAAAAVVFLAIGGVALWLTDSHSVGSPAATTDDVYVWSRVDSEELSSAKVALHGVTSGASGLVAVGWLQPSVLTSSEGTVWSPGSPSDSPEEAFDVIVWDSRYVAVGGTGAHVWTSADGTTWSPIPPEMNAWVFLGNDVVWSITEGGPGLVAVGSVDDGPAVVWTSIDGMTWTRVPHDSTVFGEDAEMLGVTQGGPGVVAVGRYGGHAAVWTSADGLSWSRVQHDPAVFGNGAHETEMLDVAAGDFGLVAVGGASDVGYISWTSQDGLAWSRGPSDRSLFDGDGEMTSVINTGSGLVAVGGEAEDAAAWTSVDGANWTRVPADGAIFGGPDIQMMADVTVGGPGLVAVGWEFNGTDGWTAAAWTAELVS